MDAHYVTTAPVCVFHHFKRFVDSRTLIKTDDSFGNANTLDDVSKQLVQSYFDKLSNDKVYIVTGFIAETLDGDTTTLGRNGSNYTAALLANYLEAEEFLNFTHVDGVFNVVLYILDRCKDRIDGYVSENLLRWLIFFCRNVSSSLLNC